MAVDFINQYVNYTADAMAMIGAANKGFKDGAADAFAALCLVAQDAVSRVGHTIPSGLAIGLTLLVGGVAFTMHNQAAQKASKAAAAKAATTANVLSSDDVNGFNAYLQDPNTSPDLKNYLEKTSGEKVGSMDQKGISKILAAKDPLYNHLSSQDMTLMEGKILNQKAVATDPQVQAALQREYDLLDKSQSAASTLSAEEIKAVDQLILKMLAEGESQNPVIFPFFNGGRNAPGTQPGPHGKTTGVIDPRIVENTSGVQGNAAAIVPMALPSFSPANAQTVYISPNGPAGGFVNPASLAPADVFKAGMAPGFINGATQVSNLNPS